MSEHVKLEANDGHKLDAYVAHPEGGPRFPAGWRRPATIPGLPGLTRQAGDDLRKS